MTTTPEYLLPARVDSPAHREHPGGPVGRWLLAARRRPGRPGERRGALQAAGLVEGHDADRRRLLLTRCPTCRPSPRSPPGPCRPWPRCSSSRSRCWACCRCTDAWPESPHGQGSVAMLENLLPFWRGKLFVLVLLASSRPPGSSPSPCRRADASVHMIRESGLPALPARPRGAHHGHPAAHPRRVFLLGFSEAVAVAIPARRGVPAAQRRHRGRRLRRRVHHGRRAERLAPRADRGARRRVRAAAAGARRVPVGWCWACPGSRTGVSMMPLVAADGEYRRAAPGLAAAQHEKSCLYHGGAYMSVVPHRDQLHHHRPHPREGVRGGGQAAGRALAFLAHEKLGEAFGTVYDISSVLILWFAGRVGDGGLINIIPRYLPSYGMAPEWGPRRAPDRPGVHGDQASASRSRSAPTSTPRPAPTPPASWP